MDTPTNSPRTGQDAQLDIYAGQFTGSEAWFLIQRRPMGGSFILARFDSETTAEGRNAIVRACNSHAALVAALEAVLQFAYENGAEDSPYPADRAAVDQARAALAAARNS